MKYVLTILAALALSCGGAKEKASTSEAELRSGCLPDGKCTIKLFPKVAAVYKKDEIGTGIYDTIPDDTQSVVVIAYEQDVPKNVQDGFYREEIVLTINAADMPPNTLFGRFCYCKESAGYFVLADKDIAVIRKRDGDADVYDITLHFETLPHRLKHLQFRLKKAP